MNPINENAFMPIMRDLLRDYLRLGDRASLDYLAPAAGEIQPHVCFVFVPRTDMAIEFAGRKETMAASVAITSGGMVRNHPATFSRS